MFRKFCGSGRPVGDTFLWYGALSDIEGMEDSDLVVNWRGERSRGWRSWAENGGGVEETFRFVCPNNPAAREKTVRRLRELLARYDFAGVFLDKIRLPSPANSVDETLSCFCGHCRDAAKDVGLDLDSVIKILADGAIDPCALRPEATGEGASSWLGALVAGSPILSRFLRFRADSVDRARGGARRGSAAHGAEGIARPVLALPCPPGRPGLPAPKQHCDWAKPMTYRLALGPAGLRLEIPALIGGVARRFGIDEGADRSTGAPATPLWTETMFLETRESAVPLSFIQAEIEAAVRTLAPAPVYFGLELVRQPRRHRRRSGARCGYGEGRQRGERSRARDLMGSDARAHRLRPRARRSGATGGETRVRRGRRPSAAPGRRRLLGVLLRHQGQRQEIGLLDVGVLSVEVQPGHFHRVVGLRIGVLIDGAEDLAVVDQLPHVLGIVAGDELDLVAPVAERRSRRRRSPRAPAR